MAEPDIRVLGTSQHHSLQALRRNEASALEYHLQFQILSLLRMYPSSLQKKRDVLHYLSQVLPILIFTLLFVAQKRVIVITKSQNKMLVDN